MRHQEHSFIPPSASSVCEHKLIPAINYCHAPNGFECQKCGQLWVPSEESISGLLNWIDEKKAKLPRHWVFINDRRTLDDVKCEIQNRLTRSRGPNK
jgi:hypothetical protein